MGFGSTAKKVQKLADTAEKLYSKLNDLREQVGDLREKLDSTSERVETLERQAAEQSALLEAIAEEQGIDPEAVEVDYPESAGAESSAEDGESENESTGDATA